MRVVFVHGACVRDGAWWWRRTADVLARSGIASDCPALPSCGEGDVPAGDGGPSLTEDVAAVRRVLLASDAPTVLVGHSYGGIVATEAAAGVGAVRHLVYVSSYLAEAGESLSTFGGPEPAPFLAVDPAAGTFAVRPEMFADTFMHDCTDDVDGARARLAAQTVAVTGQPVTSPTWHDVPSTYVVCATDRGTPADRQREFARRATHVREVDAGHHAFLARPEQVAYLLVDAGEVDAGGPSGRV